ncbi:hypothetical protein QTP86_005870 [Hemibagrus guttatus]|nr:hypothetical protein QTP86_005870 [Hemibagrus guttatus]
MAVVVNPDLDQSDVKVIDGTAVGQNDRQATGKCPGAPNGQTAPAHYHFWKVKGNRKTLERLRVGQHVQLELPCTGVDEVLKGRVKEKWITSFLTDRHQLVKLGKFKSNSRTTSTGAPQGCVLSPLLFSLYTNDCTSTDPCIKLLKFTDDTTVIGLIQDGDESAYRQEIEQLAAWCSRNNLELNTLKTMEMIVDFRRNTPAFPPLTIMNSTVPTVASFRFLGTTISQDLKWDTHIDATIKKAQQRLYFLRQLRKFNLPQELLIHFYSAVIESVLCTSITVWFGSATKSHMRRLQRTVRTAERIIGARLPTLQELYTSRPWGSQSSDFCAGPKPG